MYILFTELGWPHIKYSAVYPLPIRINVHHFEDHNVDMAVNLRPGFYEVGVEKGFIIGLIMWHHLFPFTAPSEDLNNNYIRVKLRIHGNHADVIEPIEKDDPLNLRFFQKFGPQDIRYAEISE